MPEEQNNTYATVAKYLGTAVVGAVIGWIAKPCGSGLESIAADFYKAPVASDSVIPGTNVIISYGIADGEGYVHLTKSEPNAKPKAKPVVKSHSAKKSPATTAKKPVAAKTPASEDVPDEDIKEDAGADVDMQNKP